MRMVAGHRETPAAAIAAVSRFIKPGGHVILHPVQEWSPAALAAACTPISIHHAVKRVVSSTEARNALATLCRMDTRKTPRRRFGVACPEACLPGIDRRSAK